MLFSRNAFEARSVALTLCLIIGPSSGSADEAPTAVELDPFEVTATRVAQSLPALGAASPVTLLRYDARVDVQSRGVAEQQGDIAIRGGIFENTGFRLGALPLFDPQTGHFFADIPLAPAFLSGPEVLTGTANSLYGFNSSVATVAYGFAPVRPGGAVAVSLGPPHLNAQALRVAFALGDAGAAEQAADAHGWSLELEGSRVDASDVLPRARLSQERLSGRLQWRDDAHQLDVFAGYLDKHYTWPGLYTGQAFAPGPPETDAYEVLLVGAHHSFTGSDGARYAAGLYLRELQDDYDYNFSTSNNFEHHTRVVGGGVDIEQPLGERLSLRATLQALADALVESRPLRLPSGDDDPDGLLYGRFAHRSYANTSAVLRYAQPVAGRGTWAVEGGAQLAWTNRDGSALSPVARIEWLPEAGHWPALYVSYAEATQVPGYTVLNSPPTGGLFAGNEALGRERSRNWELGLASSGSPAGLGGSLAVFYREDRALVDWVRPPESAVARQAQATDLDVRGAEALLHWAFERAFIALGYTYLEKTGAQLDASYYALNHPEHRVTTAVSWQPTDSLELQVDGEWRRQRANPLRTSGRDALLLSTSVHLRPEGWGGLELSAIVYNLTNSAFEDIPGTPAAPRQITLRLGYGW